MRSGWLNVFGGRLVKGPMIGLLELVFGLPGLVVDFMGRFST